MKKIFPVVLMSLVTGFASAQYVPTIQETSISFKIQNFGFGVTGNFSGMHGKIDFDPQNPANDRFDIIVDAGSINTDNGMRDKHLKGEDYFDVAKYPEIRFISTGISRGSKKGSLMLTGNLTIKNIIREVTFPFEVTPSNGGFIFTGSFKLKRKDFGVGGTSTISDELEVVLNVPVKRA